MDNTNYIIGRKYINDRAVTDLEMYLLNAGKELSVEEKERVVAIYIERIESLILDEMQDIFEDIITEVVMNLRRSGRRETL